MRNDLTAKILGQKKIMHEAIWGGDSVENTLYTVVVISSFFMIIGLIMTVQGILKLIRNE